MKAKSTVKIILDLTMAAVFISLLFAHNTGLVFHEIMGISLIFMIIFHLILNQKWIINISKNLFANRITSKALLMYLLNVGLLLGISVIIITGIMISNVIFPVNNYSLSLLTIHKWSSYITTAMIALHLAIHAKYLITNFKKILLYFKISNIKRAFAIIMIFATIYCSIIFATNKKILSSNINSTDDIINTNDSNQSNETIASITNNENKEEETISNPTESHTDSISLSEFLSKMFCPACHKHCPLSNPQCGKSKNYISEAKAEYQTLYGE